MRLSLVHILLCVLMALAASAQKPKFYAEVDGRKIVENSYVQVTFTLENGDGQNFKPPSFTDFNVVSGPSRSSSTTIVNGRMTKTLGFGYGLSPKGLGMKTIPPATIIANGKAMKTAPVRIEVVKGSDRSLSADRQVFVKTVLSDSTTYVGQQIILDYMMYTTLDVRSINFNTEQTFDGFYTEEMRQGRQAYQKEVVDGIEYHTKSIRRVSLYPQQTGTYEISPVSVTLGIAKQGSSRSIFFNSQLVRKNMMAEGKTIFVNALPPGSTDHSGAVGRYKMNVSTPKRSLTTDEAINVVMEITGNGDSKTVKAPRFPLPDGLEMYDPNVIEDEVFRAATGITHRKTFEYLIVAKKPGRYNLRPSFQYFNTDSNEYVTLTQDLPRINVIKGSATQAVINTDEEVELAGIFEKTKLKKIGTSSSSLGLHWLLFILPFLAGMGIVLYGNHLEKSGKNDPELIKREKAYEVAIERLKTARSHMEKDDSKKFHEEMIIALKTYVTDKYAIQALHIKKSELLEQLSGRSLSEDALGKFREILNKSEMAMYAPAQSSDLKATYDDAIGLISSLEN